MNKFINTALLSNPYNWATVGAMIALALVAGFVIHSRMVASAPAVEPSAQPAKSSET